MQAIEQILPESPRVTVLRPGALGAGRAILLWVQRAQRATCNHAANVAVELANRLRLPVIAVFCLTPSYPRATWRAYHFMAEGLQEMPGAFSRRGIGWILRIGEPEEVIPALAAGTPAAAVVTDQDPLRPGRLWRERVAARLSVPLVAVETDVIVPTAYLPKEEWAPRTIRPKLRRHLPHELVPVPEPVATVPARVREGPDPVAALEELPIDRSVPPVAGLRGGATAGRARLERFIAHGLPRYHEQRLNATVDGTSRLSPYLHFGQMSPLQVALAALEAERNGVPQAAVEAFLDELITQRELAINFCLRNPAYDQYAGLPSWGQETLRRHVHDPRPVIYTLDEFAAAATHDRVWNACQRQMATEGWLPNVLRMYWAKQLLYWTRTPEEAHAIAVELNDRFFVDGRDANGYAQIAWSIGGRHDRPFPPEKPVIGLVRPMGLGALRKRFDVAAYVAEIERRAGS